MEKLLTKDQIKSINNTLIDAYGAGTSITNIEQFPKDSLKALGGDNVKPAVSDYINNFNKTGKMLEIARTLVEQARGKNSKYKKFKEAVLAYYGVNTPDELEPVKKKEFYKYIDEQWKRFKASLNPKKETQQ